MLDRSLELVRLSSAVVGKSTISGFLPPNPTATDLGVVFKGLTNAMGPVRTRRLTTHHPTRLPNVLAEETLLTGILANVVENGLRASHQSDEPGIQISVDEGPYVSISVEDHGPGMDPALLSRVLDEPTNGESRQPTSGVGLYLAQQILQVWGGRIEIPRSDASGTLVRILLQPANEGDAVADGRSRGSRLPGTSTGRATGARGRPRLLLLDDHHIVATVLSERLTEIGFDVLVANTSAQALELLRDAWLDVAVLDVVLHDSNETDGIDIAAAVRQTNPAALVVAFSGNISPSSVARLRANQVDDIISKADFPRLLASMEEACRLWKERRASIGDGYLESVVTRTLTSIAHELRGPLVSVQRNAEAIQSEVLGRLNEPQQVAAASILREIRRGFNLIDAHLRLERIRRRLDERSAPRCDIVTVVQSIVDSRGLLLHGGGVQVRLLLPDAPCMVSMDAAEVHAALNPILDNAAKYSAPDGTIDLKVVANGPIARVGISDSGPGMSPDDVARILDWRYGHGGRVSQRAQSTGLGLTISRRIVELGGGRLEIETSAGGGTTVWLLLPTSDSEGAGGI